MSDHGHYREWAAAYVLGALDLDELRGFETHLEQCEQCRSEVAELAAIPAMLARIEAPDRAVPPDAVMARAMERIEEERSSLVRSKRRWQWLAAAAALFAFAAFVSFVGVELGGSEPAAATSLLVENDSVPAQVTIAERAWGTAIDLELDGLPPLDEYVAWAVDRAGTWQQVAAWGPTPNGRAVVSGASSFATADLASVVVTSGDRSTTLVTARSPG
jgi:predicted anti-sigma-YlaC factor YlaD